MKDGEKEFEDFVGQIEFDDTPDPSHRDKLEQDLLAALATRPREKEEPLQIWRIIMKTKITKLATAALIILAVAVSITIFNHSASSAWAIEQSIEVLSTYKAILVEGSECTFEKDGGLQQRCFKWWGVANEDQTMVKKVRMEVDGVAIITTNGQKTWRYDPQTNTVIKNRPYGTPECWLGSQFLEQLKDFRDSGVINRWEITYGKDPATGKQRAFLKIAWLEERYNGPRSLWIEVDMESKLLVSAKQWENANWEGPARMVAEKITYHENLPDDLFDFEIPQGAKVIEE